jgi:hypothetical protein
MKDLQEVSNQDLLKEVSNRKLEVICNFCKEKIPNTALSIYQKGEYYHFQNKCYEKNQEIERLVNATIRD